MKPRKLTLRTYQVGFGDCFLLSFAYPREERHVLIDFGSTGQSESLDAGHMVTVAEHIKARCRGKLHAIVATHRHKDHISGFSTDGRASGTVIAACEPDVILQPWTEDPDARKNATKPTQVEAFTNALTSMHHVAGSALEQLDMLRLHHLSPSLLGQLSFIGEDNLPNISAVQNLQAMGSVHIYAHTGSTAGLDDVLPGVTVHVLGPPTLEQSETIRKQRSKDPDEFWHLQRRFWGMQAAAAVTRTGQQMFPDHRVPETPATSAWLCRQLRQIHGEQLLELVRSLDKAMNNTSLILLFEVGKKKLLFPGDAQLENWAYALNQAEYRDLLADVQVYKVGHHGSLNATPKTLWNLFARRSKNPSPERLQSVVSTMIGKHGSEDRGTEVPRSKLVNALKAETEYFTTQSLKSPREFFQDLEIAIE